MTASFNGRRVVALCNYELVVQTDYQQMNDVMRVHHCALEHSDSSTHLTVMSRSITVNAEGAL